MLVRLRAPAVPLADWIRAQQHLLAFFPYLRRIESRTNSSRDIGLEPGCAARVWAR